MTRSAALAVFMILTGCPHPTEFEGAPKVPGGLTGCQTMCRRDGLELGAFVYSGEFSTSCVCRPPSAPAPAAPGAETAPTAGVEVQTQAAAAAAAAAAQRLQQQQQQQQQQRQ